MRAEHFYSPLRPKTSGGRYVYVRRAKHDTMERRTDQVTAMLLDVARNATRLHGAVPPLLELKRLGIPMETIVRVLGDVENRRGSIEFALLKPTHRYTGPT